MFGASHGLTVSGIGVLLNGSITGDVTVNASAWLGGNGTIAGRLAATITYAGGDGNDVALNVESLGTRIDLIVVREASELNDWGELVGLPGSAEWVHE